MGVTGASGAIYAKRLFIKLQSIKEQFEECSIVYTSNALDIWKYELGKLPEVMDAPFKVWDEYDFYAPFASGSSEYNIMIIIPCSMGTLGRIASGVSDNLIARAADVMLKERRRLILVTRENPFNLIHLRNMTLVTEAGAIISTASPSFYSLPITIEEAVDTVVERVLSLAGFKIDCFKWDGRRDSIISV